MSKNKILLLSLLSMTLVLAAYAAGVMVHRTRNQPSLDSRLGNFEILQPFLPERLDYRQIEDNPRTGRFSFSFKTSLKSPQVFFRMVAMRAVNGGWQLKKSSRLRQVYIAPLMQNSGEKSHQKVTLEYDPKLFRVTLSLEYY